MHMRVLTLPGWPLTLLRSPCLHSTPCSGGYGGYGGYGQQGGYGGCAPAPPLRRRGTGVLCL